MMISGQCLIDTALLHDNEGQAISHAPFLVASFSSSRVDQSGGPSRLRERAVFRNDWGEAEHSSSVSIVTTTRVFGKRARGSSGLRTWPSKVGCTICVMFLVPDSPMEGSFEAASPAPSYLPPRNRPTATASSLDEIGAVMATCFGLAARETSSGWGADRELAREQ